jgi:hypothetical protein
MRNGHDVAITTAEHIATMLEDDNPEHHADAIRVIRTFVHALRLTAPPKRPRKSRAPKVVTEVGEPRKVG